MDGDFFLLKTSYLGPPGNPMVHPLEKGIRLNYEYQPQHDTAKPLNLTSNNTPHLPNVHLVSEWRFNTKIPQKCIIYQIKYFVLVKK